MDVALATINNPSGSTIILGLHRAGYTIPLNVSGAEVGGGETAYTMRPATGRDEFLLFMSDTLAITAVSHETMTMLGVSIRTRRTSAVSWLLHRVAMSLNGLAWAADWFQRRVTYRAAHSIHGGENGASPGGQSCGHATGSMHSG
jgi:hypothetical protein